MNFETIITSIASAYNTQPEIDLQAQDAFFHVNGNILTLIALAKHIDGVQWFEQRILIGRVVDPSQLPLHTLLFENSRRESPYFLFSMGKDTWLGIKDRYALLDTTPDSDAADVLQARITGMIGIVKWDIPGIEFVSGLQ